LVIKSEEAGLAIHGAALPAAGEIGATNATEKPSRENRLLGHGLPSPHIPRALTPSTTIGAGAPSEAATHRDPRRLMLRSRRSRRARDRRRCRGSRASTPVSPGRGGGAETGRSTRHPRPRADRAAPRRNRNVEPDRTAKRLKSLARQIQRRLRELDPMIVRYPRSLGGFH